MPTSNEGETPQLDHDSPSSSPDTNFGPVYIRRDTTPMSQEEILAALRDQRDQQTYLSSILPPPPEKPIDTVIPPPARAPRR